MTEQGRAGRNMATKGDKAIDDKLLARMKEVSRQREATQVIQLPLWPEPKRGTPNSFIRSAEDRNFKRCFPAHGPAA